MEQFDHLEVAQEAATILKAGDTNKAAAFLRQVASDLGGIQAFAADLRKEKDFYAQELGLPVADIEWMACILEGNTPDADAVALELKAKIATLAALEAFSLMAKKAGVEPKVIMKAVFADPDGNTARYFNDLVQTAMREVPKLLAV